MIKKEAVVKSMDDEVVPVGNGGKRPGAGRKAGVEIGNYDAYQEYSKARAKKEIHNAKMAELEEGIMAGKLVEVDVVRAEWEDVLATVRGKLLAMPSKLAPQALGAKNMAQMQAILMAGVREVLTELATDE